MNNAIVVYNPDIALEVINKSFDKLYVIVEGTALAGHSFDNILIPYPLDFEYLKFLETKLNIGGKLIYLYPKKLDEIYK